MKTIALIVTLLALSACTQQEVTQALSSPAGQLFCAINQGGAGTIVAGLIDGAATAKAPSAAPVVVVATNATQASVQANCNAAARAIGGTVGIPVSPPANAAGAPQVTIPHAVPLKYQDG